MFPFFAPKKSEKEEARFMVQKKSLRIEKIGRGRRRERVIIGSGLTPEDAEKMQRPYGGRLDITFDRRNGTVRISKGRVTEVDIHGIAMELGENIGVNGISGLKDGRNNFARLGARGA